MGAFTNYLEKLGSNFLVAAMVPSMALVVAFIFVFDPIFHIAEFFINPKGTQQLVSLGIVVFIFTVIIGFTLTALNTFVLKMFEGYVIPLPVNFLYRKAKRIHQRKAQRLKWKRDWLKHQILKREESAPYPGQKDELRVLRRRYYGVASRYNLNYPEDPGDVMPTRFGNTLKAAENYPRERYGFDGVIIWPRLFQVIPNEYKLNIDSVRNELSFLVNMSVLSIFFSFLCILAVFYTMLKVKGAGSDPSFYFQFLKDAIPFLFIAAISLAIARFFYEASIFSVGSYGLVVRSSFDLFRMDLLKKLHVPRPENSNKEFYAWKELNELIVLGKHSLTHSQIDYRREE
jgi:hypothetical protein